MTTKKVYSKMKVEFRLKKGDITTGHSYLNG